MREMRSSTGMGHVGRPQGQPGGCQFGLGEEDSRMSGLKGTPQARASERRIIHRAANPSPYTSPTASAQARSSHDGYEFGQSLSHESGAGSPESRARRGGRGEARGVDGRAGGGGGGAPPAAATAPASDADAPAPDASAPAAPAAPAPAAADGAAAGSRNSTEMRTPDEPPAAGKTRMPVTRPPARSIAAAAKVWPASAVTPSGRSTAPGRPAAATTRAWPAASMALSALGLALVEEVAELLGALVAVVGALVVWDVRFSMPQSSQSSSSSACTSSLCTAEGGQRGEKDGWLGCQSGGMGEECEQGGLMGGPGARWHALCPAARARFDVRASGGSGIVRGLRSRTAERRPAPCAWAACIDQDVRQLLDRNLRAEGVARKRRRDLALTAGARARLGAESTVAYRL